MGWRYSSIEGLSHRRSMDYPTNTTTLTSEMDMLGLLCPVFASLCSGIWDHTGRSESHMVRHPSWRPAAVSNNAHIKYSCGLGDKLLYNMSNILFDTIYILTIYRTMVTIFTTGFSNKRLYTLPTQHIYGFRTVPAMNRNSYSVHQRLGLLYGNAVSCEVRTEVLNVIYTNFRFQQIKLLQSMMVRTLMSVFVDHTWYWRTGRAEKCPTL